MHTTQHTDVELAVAIAELLGSIDGWQWAAHGQYALGAGAAVPVYVGALPLETDVGAALAVYSAVDDPRQALRRVQLRLRGGRDDRLGALRLADSAYAALHGLSTRGIIALMQRTAAADLGRDGDGRQERADSYLVTLDV